MHNDVREFYIGTSIGLLPKATEPKRIYYGIVSVSVFMFFCVLLSVLFVYLENLQISRPSYIMLNYIAALLTLSTKDFLSHLVTIQPDDMVICSLNVRGLSNNTKRRETFLWLKKKSSPFTFCKRCIAQMRQNLIGILNGDQIRLSLQPSQALGEALLYCSTTISISNSETFCRPRREVYYYRQILGTKL